MRSLDRQREAIIAHEISRFYLKPKRPRLSHLVDRIGSRCHQEGLPIPDWQTIRARVRSLDAEFIARKRQDRAALARTRAVPGEFTFNAFHPVNSEII